MVSTEIAVLTLNVWGIPLISKNRKERINGITDQLMSGKYDIVSLQEVWSQSDSETLREKTSSIFPYSHYFFSGVNGAGLLVLSKYPIIAAFFHAWSLNGYFHRVQHADWFGGKGVGLCKILFGDRIIHFYNAHLHAEYDIHNDCYKTHRVIQAFDTGQFIEATRGDSLLQIIAGDLNTQPDQISYKILLYASKMQDCWKSSSSNATTECKRNSYTSKSILEKNPDGIRIDHIFVRNGDDVDVSVVEYDLPFPDRVPGQKFSFSDHEAVLAKLQIKKRSVSKLKLRQNPLKSIMENGDKSCSAHNISTEPNLDSDSNNCNQIIELEHKSSERVVHVKNNVSLLKECIAICEESLKSLKTDRIVYIGIAGLFMLIIILLVEFVVPNGFRTLYFLVKLLFFTVVVYCVFMATIWNYIERNGILAGKMAMEVMLRNENIK